MKRGDIHIAACAIACRYGYIEKGDTFLILDVTPISFGNPLVEMLHAGKIVSRQMSAEALELWTMQD